MQGTEVYSFFFFLNDPAPPDSSPLPPPAPLPIGPAARPGPDDDVRDAVAVDVPGGHVHPAGELRVEGHELGHDRVGRVPDDDLRKGAGPGAGGVQDRKSTRLNSSHLVISYAVFCL